MSRLDLPLSHAAVRSDLRRLANFPTWLRAADDDERLRSTLEASVAELASGQWTLADCKTRLRLDPTERWKASCRLTLTQPDGDARTVWLVGDFDPRRAGTPSQPEVVGVLGERGWYADLPELGLTLRVEADERLPALTDLRDATGARAILEPCLQHGWPGARIVSCVPEVMRYKPGSRCTIRYRVGYAPGPSGPAIVVAKVHHGGKGRNAYAAMKALDQASIAPATVTLAEPLGYREDLRVLVQAGVAEDETLERRVRRAFAEPDASPVEQLRGDVARAARALAAIHSRGVAPGDVVSFEDELFATRGLVRRIAAGITAACAGAATPYLDAIAAAARQCPSDDAVGVHGSFRPAQVLLADRSIAVIDFDGFAAAEPALDVALLRAGLRRLAVGPPPPARPAALRARLDSVDELCEHFLATYEQTNPVSRDRVALWESLYLFHAVLTCWTKVRPTRLPLHIATFERHLFAAFDLRN